MSARRGRPGKPTIGLTAGFSYILAARGLTGIGRLEENSTWLYLMTDVGF